MAKQTAVSVTPTLVKNDEIRNLYALLIAAQRQAQSSINHFRESLGGDITTITNVIEWHGDSMIKAAGMVELTTELLKILESGVLGGAPWLSFQVLVTKRLLESRPTETSAHQTKNILVVGRVAALIHILNLLK